MVVCGKPHAPAPLPPPPERTPVTHWIGGWSGHIAGLDIVEESLASVGIRILATYTR
jgi:hypothetical protein